jgi:hypothetical protein
MWRNRLSSSGGAAAFAFIGIATLMLEDDTSSRLFGGGLAIASIAFLGRCAVAFSVAVDPQVVVVRSTFRTTRITTSQILRIDPTRRLVVARERWVLCVRLVDRDLTFPDFSQRARDSGVVTDVAGLVRSVTDSDR